jgi:acyl carrier protein
MTTERAALLEFLASRVVPLPDEGDDASLIRSGLIDSVALLDLILWIEARLGHAIDPTRVELFDELDSVSRILRFLQRERARG